MSLISRFSPPSLTSEQYDSVVRRLTEEGISPADGLDYEICFDAFVPRLMPILAELGIDPGQPEMFEVHNIIKR
jgi:hypothetical protein